VTARWYDIPTGDWVTLQRRLRGVIRDVSDDQLAALSNVTTSTTVTLTNATNVVTVDTSAGNVTVTLPVVGTVPGRTVTTVKLSAANTLTVDGDGATINGSATISWTTQYQTYTLYSTGTEWLIL
jgi:hypothetical protein